MRFLGDLGGAAHDRAIVTNAGFAVYALDSNLGGRSRVNRWGTEGEQDGPATFTHVVVSTPISRRDARGTISVSSSPVDPVHATDSSSEAASGLASVLLDDAMRAGSWQAMPASERDQDIAEMLDKVSEQAARSESSEVDVTVDGRTVTFALARDIAGAWCAAAALESIVVKITSHQVDPLSHQLALVRIVEPSVYFRD
jgi:hypothetical protein